MIKFEIVDNGQKGSIQLLEADLLAGALTFTWAGDDKFIIDHTEVDAAFGGKGYGKLLVMEAVAFARKKQVKIIPLCPYAKRVFEKDNSIQDVLV
ncbi:MAG TPA: GNAT family N-acetyltransferase [Edaphocola sp.]|nr:GNAT family N-acetyltransferase [Edaphocola sp.]